MVTVPPGNTKPNTDESGIYLCVYIYICLYIYIYIYIYIFIYILCTICVSAFMGVGVYVF